MNASLLTGLLLTLAWPGLAADWFAASVAEVRAAAGRGEAAAQYALGERLLRGRDGKVELEEAYRWFSRAGNGGVVEAQLRMGMKHERAVGTRRDVAEAARWYELAAAKGSLAAQFRLACLNSLNRQAGRLDVVATLRWVEPLAERGHGPSVLLRAAAVAAMRVTNQPPAKVGAWFRAAAEIGSAAEQRRYAEWLAPSDPKAAWYWWEVAQASGAKGASPALTKVQGSLGTLDRVGETLRAKLFEQKPPGAVSLGNLDPLHHFDLEFQPVESTRVELARLRQAAEGGNAAAQFQLALAHQLAPAFTNHLQALSGGVAVVNGVLGNGSFMQPHLDEAVRWHLAAAKQGYAPAVVCLAWLVNSGVVNHSMKPAEALAWMKSAAEAGDAASAYGYGLLHQRGLRIGPTTSYSVRIQHELETDEWMRKAANRGHLPAQTNLAERIHTRGGAQPEVLSLLLAAEKQGDIGAKDRLARWFGITRSLALATVAGAAPTQPPTITRPRLAIVPLAEGVKPFADLLAVELSRRPEITLLERAETDRIYREQSASAVNRDTLKLGQLLGAQGVLLVETNTVEGKAWAALRLVAVQPGVTLHTAQVPWPIEDSPAWSQRVARQVEPLLGKLGVARAAAVPVSLLGLRMAVAGPEAAETEQSLSLLVAHRLAQERELFVLERRSMERLAAEQELDGLTGVTFWSGGHVVEGTIDRNPVERDALRVLVRLTSPGGQPANVEVTGPQANLAQLADTLVRGVLGTLRHPPTTVWRPEEEGVRFLEQALWARRWGLWREAAAAAESAWALGLQGPDQAALRLDVLAGSIQPVSLVWPGTKHRPAILRRPPDAANVGYSERALAGFLAQAQSLTSEQLIKEPVWLALGAAALTRTGQTLADYYQAVEHRAEMGGRLEQLRRTAREAADLLLKLPAVADGRVAWQGSGLRTVLGAGSGEVNLPLVLALHGRCWQEGPDGVLELHRNLIQASGFGGVRGYFLSIEPTPLIAWRTAERQGLSHRWREHQQQLVNSTNRITHIEGLLTRLHYASETNALHMGIQQLMAAAWQDRDALINGQLAPHSWEAIYGACTARRNHSSSKIEDLLASVRHELVDPQDRRIREHAAVTMASRAHDYLRTATSHDPSQFARLVAFPSYPAARAGELLPLAKAYELRVARSAYDVNKAIERLTVMAGLQTAAPAAPAPLVVEPAPTQAAEPAMNALRVSRFWLAPEMRRTLQERFGATAPDHKINARYLAIHHAAWREDKLWLAWKHYSHDYLGNPTRNWWSESCSHVSPVSLPDLKGDARPPDLPPLIAFGMEPSLPVPTMPFEVLDGQVYVAGSNAVYRVRGDQAERLPVSVSGYSRLQAVHGRLVVCAAGAILAYDPKQDTVETLASARRRPALNLLDQLDNLGLPVPVAVAGGRLRVAVQSDVYEYDFLTRQWSALPNFRRPANTTNIRVHEDAVEFHTAAHHPVGFACRLPATATNWLFTAMRIPPSPQPGFMFSVGPSLPGLPEWMPADPELSPVVIATASGSNLVWAITAIKFEADPASEHPSLGATKGVHARLAAYRVGVKQPAVVPLWFDLPPNALHRSAISLFRGGGRIATDQLMSTPHGLVCLSPAVPGFWLLPWSELLPRVEPELARLAAEQSQPLPRGSDRSALWLRNYDGNRDGKLDYREFHWFALGERLVTDGMGWMQLKTRFTVADKNRDGGLDAAELASMTGMPSARPPGQTNAPGSLMLKYDKNKNGRLDPEEMEAFIADRKKAGEPVPPGAVPNLKSKPCTCDEVSPLLSAGSGLPRGRRPAASGQGSGLLRVARSLERPPGCGDSSGRRARPGRRAILSGPAPPRRHRYAQGSGSCPGLAAEGRSARPCGGARRTGPLSLSRLGRPAGPSGGTARRP